MPNIAIEVPDIVTISYRQTKDDPDYGSCLWARFNFDKKNYHMSIESDCGNYSYGWVPTPKSESFLHLCSRFEGGYLLDKIARRSVVDSEQTFQNVKEMVADFDDLEDFFKKDIESACGYFRTDVTAAVNAMQQALEDAGYFEYGCYEVSYCVEMDYPCDAKKIAEVYDNFIRPAVQELVKEETK